MHRDKFDINTFRESIAKLVASEEKLEDFEVFSFTVGSIDNVKDKVVNYVGNSPCTYMLISNSFRIAYLRSRKQQLVEKVNYESIDIPIIYIGESSDGSGRLKKLFKLLKGGKYAHSGGKKIRKFMKDYSKYFQIENYFFHLIIFIPSQGCYKDLEGCFLHIFRNMFGSYPLFNDRKEPCCCLKGIAYKILIEIRRCLNES